MKFLTWLKSLWTRRKVKLRLVPREQTSTTSVHWNAQYHYKPEKKEEGNNGQTREAQAKQSDTAISAETPKS